MPNKTKRTTREYNPKQPPRETIAVKMRRDLFRMIYEYANMQGWSMSKTVNVCLRDYFRLTAEGRRQKRRTRP